MAEKLLADVENAESEVKRLEQRVEDTQKKFPEKKKRIVLAKKTITSLQGQLKNKPVEFIQEKQMELVSMRSVSPRGLLHVGYGAN